MNLSEITYLFLLYKYPIIFLLTVVEGPLIMILCGVLIRTATVNFWPVYLTLIAADLTGDTFWYFVGYHFAHPISEKYGKYIGLSPEILEKTRIRFRNHEKKILFISKITLGLGFALAPLVLAGMSKMPFRKYITTLFFGQFIWTGGMLAVGYFFGDVYTKINKNFQIVSIIAFIFAVFFILKGVRSYLQKRNLDDLNK